MEEVAQTWPSRAATMSGRNALRQLTTPIRSTPMIQSMSSSDISINAWNDVTPALANRSETGPSAAFASSFACRTDARSETSQASATAVPSAAPISSATARAFSSRMSATTTAAPSTASALARARPIPLPPPVTNATRPAISVTPDYWIGSSPASVVRCISRRDAGS